MINAKKIFIKKYVNISEKILSFGKKICFSYIFENQY